VAAVRLLCDGQFLTAHICSTRASGREARVKLCGYKTGLAALKGGLPFLTLFVGDFGEQIFGNGEGVTGL